jgi:hypothetical protein
VSQGPLASQASHPGPSWPAASGNLGAPQVDPAVRPSDRAQGQDILFYAGVDGHVFFPHVLSHYKNKKNNSYKLQGLIRLHAL